MLSPKQIRQSRGRLALALAVAYIVVIFIVCLLHPAGKTALGTVQIVYSGASALLVTMVILFGIGSWSRFLPRTRAERRQTRERRQPASTAKSSRRRPRS